MESTGEMRVLIVEDDKDTASVVQILLKTKLQASSDIAQDCASARQSLASNSYDLITMDYQLPDGDGLSLMEEIVGRDNAPPVVMVTGHGDEQTAVAAFKLGASGYVVKDTRLSTMLVEEARSALARAEVKRSEEALRAGEERYRTLFDNMMEGFAFCRMVYDDDDNPIDWLYLDTNKAFEPLTGLRDVIGKYATEIMPGLEETNPESFEIQGRVAATGRSEQFEVRVVPLSRDLLIKVFCPLKGYFAAVFENITERKRAEEAEKEKERQLSLMFDSVAEVMYFLSVEPDDRYRFLTVNDAFLKATGLLENQVVGKYVHEVIPEPSLTLVLAKYEQAIQNNATVRWEEITNYPAGRKYGDVAVTPIVDSRGCCTNLLGSVHDVTERKAAEEALQVANLELEAYAHTVSHDLKGPLSNIAAAANLLPGILEGDEGKALEGDAGDALRIIGDNTRRSVMLIESLLELARAGQAPLKHEPMDISGVVRAILKEKEALLEERGTRVSLEGDLGVAAMDPTHAYQVFSNLIANAIKHNDSENPSIHISRQGEAGPWAARYLVCDNGPGIPEGAEEDIFLPFHTGPNSTDTGIGLSIVDKVVKLYGGTIRAYNDRGACFEFTLPIDSSQGEGN